MRKMPNEAQWAAARALAEGALPTHARIAALLGVGVPAISHRAEREGWTHLDFRRGGVRAAHRALARLAGAAEAGGSSRRNAACAKG